MTPLRLGLVGGGPGAFIGPVHRLAAEMDREILLVAGAFSSDAARSSAAGEQYGLDPRRAYPSYDAMIAGERSRADGIEAVAIATPNHLHLSVARAALEAGLAVISDKPATATLEEALELQAVVARCGRPYALTYTYTGYAMVREMRARVMAGAIGKVRKIHVEYLQGWLTQAIERDGNRQAAWRVDPAKAGLGGCIGDIGVHAFNLVEFVVDARVTAISADLATVVPGRQLDDDCTVLLRFDDGARGVLIASQVATGERNNLRLRVYGEEGALEWCHEAADRLTMTGLDGEVRTIWQGSGLVGPEASRVSRLPAGHPEGYLEAFANIYRDFAKRLRGGDAPLLPGIEEGVRSMRFVATAVGANSPEWLELGA
ncbi:MAG TPA: Gfo/Idh/MocA family oxidoreductase [Sphingomonas sp.]|nr:Gfo/Idh/MocA family oxidoreductase [Sphingomonas sp.]